MFSMLKLSIGVTGLLLGAAASALAAGVRDAGSYIADTEPLSAETQREKFHLPKGFAIQLVAAEPRIGKPINLNFDARGRLYVTQSAEYPLPAVEAAAPGDRIVRLSTIAADGNAEMVETVVDRLDIPIGVLPLPQKLVYYSIPNIYVRDEQNLEDRDGPATKQKTDASHQGGPSAISGPGHKLFGPFDYADTHGMASSFTPWLDGWIYACHGYGNESKIPMGQAATVHLSSGCTFRFLADGSRFERFTQGQVNPFGLAFNDHGDLFSADCSTKPLYTLLRGAWYPNYSRPHDGLGFGPEMMRHSHGSTGIAGVAFCTGDHFPAVLQGTVFVGNPVTGHINHDRLETHGSTYQAVALDDFITCDDPWFRPVDLKLGPDGALYIADFYNCVIGHEEVPLTHPRRDHTRGRIWRVVYTGRDGKNQPPAPLPDLAAQPAERLIALLGDTNQTVRMLAAEQLMSQSISPSALAAALTADSSEPSAALRKAHVLWLAERATAGGLGIDVVERLAADRAAVVHIYLLKMLANRGIWSELRLFELVRSHLEDDDPFARRAAADALGQHPAPENLQPLLALWRNTPGEDRNLIHTTRMALRDHLLEPGMYAFAAPLTGANPEDAARIADVSLGVHTPASAEYLFNFVKTHELRETQLSEYLHEAIRYADHERLSDLFKQVQQLAAGSTARQHAALTATVRASRERGEPLPAPLAAWGRDLVGSLLKARDERSVRQGIELASELRSPETFASLAAIAGRGSRFEKLRPAAIDACAAVDADQALTALTAILADPADAITVRQKAAESLASLNQPGTREALVAQLRAVPEDVSVVIARSLSTSAAGGDLLLSEIAAGRCSRQLLNDFIVQSQLSRLPELTARLAELSADLPPVDVRVQKLIRDRRKGFDKAKVVQDAGREVFQKTCAICHQIGGQGARIGPPLDGVGLRGLDRLLEDTLDPSRNVDPSFRTLLVQFDGKVLTGLPLRKEGELLVLAGADGKEFRVPADAEQFTSKVSPMPANIAEQIPEADYYNLLGFLLEQKQAPEPKSGESSAR